MHDLLNETRVTGKIGRAAERAGVSYRHAWNPIEKWSTFFDAPLAERKQGRGTNLTVVRKNSIRASCSYLLEPVFRVQSAEHFLRRRTCSAGRR